MTNKLLIIDGEDFTGYLKADKGYSVRRGDVDSDQAGRVSLNATMYRDRQAVKMQLNLACRPLTGEETRKILNAIYPEFVSVTYNDPRVGVRADVQMYSNNVPAEFLFEDSDGVERWGGITFPLIER